MKRLSDFFILIGCLFLGASYAAGRSRVHEVSSPSLSSWVSQWNKKWKKDWTIVLEQWDQTPFQWTLSSDTRPTGFRLRFTHKTKTTLEEKAYEKNSPGIQVPLRWTIYFYTRLQGGYRYSAFERKHPDRWWGYVDNLMVLLPSEASDEKNTLGTEQIEMDILSFLKSTDQRLYKKWQRFEGPKPWILLNEKEKGHYSKLSSKKRAFYVYQSSDTSSFELDVQGPL